ncbi:uncharacterized protein C2845_PM01G02640 [Panicum miliaceum]|uniref:RING-type domain-containing protein n=1 Tax=Panicum miliaceum TaxID=4540 RepID=A0A3L6TP86_PANMI|nr:uncharacterized protein C2845_PM01G02640 [Panicum miliaceum]
MPGEETLNSYLANLYMEGSDQSNPCAICLGGMGAGGGQAIFTAECSHTFHFHCISASVAHGHLVCPLCNSQWRELPFVRPEQPAPVPPALPQQPPMPRHEPIHHVQPPPIRRRPMHGVQPPLQSAEPEVFDDDEQVEPRSGADGQRQAAAASAAPAGGTAHDASFATPAMRAMLLRSRKAREASAGQQQPEVGEETASSGPTEEVTK